MTPERQKHLRAHIRRIADEFGRAATLSEMWRLVREAEVFDEEELDEFAREAGARAIERALQADTALRRRFEEAGPAAIEDPLVQARLRQLVEEDLTRWEEGEGLR